MKTLSDAEQVDLFDNTEQRLATIKEQLEDHRATHTEALNDALTTYEELTDEHEHIHGVTNSVLGEHSIAHDIQDAAKPTKTVRHLAQTLAGHADHLAEHAAKHNEYNDALRRIHDDAQTILHDIHDTDDAIHDAYDTFAANGDQPATLQPAFDIYTERLNRLDNELSQLDNVHYEPSNVDANSLSEHAQKIRDHLAGLDDADNPDKEHHDFTELKHHAQAIHDTIHDTLASILDVHPSANGVKAYTARVNAAYDAAYHVVQAKHELARQLRDITADLQSKARQLETVSDELSKHRHDFINATRRLKDLLYTEIRTEDHADNHGRVPDNAVPDELHEEAQHLRQRQRAFIRSYITTLRRAQTMISPSRLAITPAYQALHAFDNATTDKLLGDNDLNSYLRDNFTDDYYLSLPDEDDTHRDHDDLRVAQAMNDVITTIDDAINELR